MQRVQTGNRTLDSALAGGVPPGSALLLSGEEGAGATEFALALLRNAASARSEAHVRFLSALRSPARIRAEYLELLEDAAAAKALEIGRLDAAGMERDAVKTLDGLSEGDVLVVESADALAEPGCADHVPVWWRRLADAAGERGVIVLLLHSPGTLPPGVEAALAEAADGILHFAWQQSGAMRRRVLSMPKLRGLPPLLDGGEVPLFEIALHHGVGFDVSRGRSVL